MAFQRALDVAFAALAVAFSFVLYRRILKAPNHSLPPGPRRLPFIQNLLDLPKGFEAPFWAKHKALYGESIHTYLRGANTSEA